MALNIRNPEAADLARRLARTTGRSITDAVIYALREQLRREGVGTTGPDLSGQLMDLAGQLMEIGRHCAALPDVDHRSAEEILGYDDRGVSP